MRLLFADGNLPDVQTLVSSSGNGIYRDSFGHADEILESLGELVWLQAIYGVALQSYAYDSGYATDLKNIAHTIMSNHDPAYNTP